MEFTIKIKSYVLSHLNVSTNTIMQTTKKEKIDWVKKNHFVYHPKAKACLDELHWIIELSADKDSDFIVDQEGMSIIGYSGVGKSAIINEFLQSYSVEPYLEKEYFIGKHCLLKDSITGLQGTYSALVAPFGHPYGNHYIVRTRRIRVSELENILLYLLRTTRVKIFFIDEFQHVRGRNLQAILNQIKRTMLESGIPFIPVGTPEVADILSLDDQLADRCPVKDCTHLDLWTYDKYFRRFLKGYEQFLPFPESSNLSSKALSRHIFDKVKYDFIITSDGRKLEHNHAEKTNLRRITRFLKRSAIIALRQNLDCITEQIIDDPRM